MNGGNLVDYYKLVGRPGGELQVKDDKDKNDQKFCDIDEFVEIKALIGGTTSITGISGRSQTPPVPSCVLGLARNLDWASGFYGSGASNERVENTLGVTPGDLHEDVLQRILGELSSNKIDLLLVHVAEGAPEDLESGVEFRSVKGAGLLGSHTAIIHGVALGPDQFKDMASSGTALVWSPRSNFELYGFTADVASAKKANLSIALVPDWSPTGSANSLAELRYAKQVSHEKLADLFSDQDLFEMSTSIPARIARIDDKVGSVKRGLYADLFVLAGDSAQPYAALTHAKPEDVQLVLVGGVHVYGSDKLMAAFAVKTEEVDVCGRKMYLNAAALVDGPLGDVTTRLAGDLKAYKLDLGPLVECTSKVGHDFQRNNQNMPTLFTALRAHTQRQRAQRQKAQPAVSTAVPAAGQTGYTAEIVAVPAEAPRIVRKLKEPKRLMSLRDRFLVNRKAVGLRKVVVVGGGFAGLSAAYELESLGYQVTVLEGQAEVGGRVKSCHKIVPGNVMEKGAELIGLNHPAWWSYKRKFNLHFRQLSDPPSPPVFLDGKRIVGAMAQDLSREMDGVQKRINRIARRVHAHEPWKSRNAAALDRLSLVQALNRIPMSRLCRLAFRELLQSDNGVPADRQSWLGNLAMIKGGGLSRFWTDTETHHCVEGNQSLAFAFKAELKKVLLKSKVKSIEIHGNRVRVSVFKTISLEADDVVIAIPPTMWGEITFRPTLPASYSVQFGNNVKYLLNVRKGSWRPELPT